MPWNSKGEHIDQFLTITKIMDTLKGWFTGQRSDEPSASVLAEWNKYSSDSTNSAGPSRAADTLLASAEEGAATVSRLLGTSFKAVSTGVTGAAASVSTGVSSMNVPSGMQLTYFAAILGAGVAFLALAVFLFLPMIILSPSKFAISFSVGSGLILASIGALRGWKQQLQHMISKERLPFTAAYLGSLAGTIYASLFLHSYIFSLLFCGAQVVALLYYMLSYFPGGSAGAQFMIGMVGRMFGQACGAVTRAIFK